MNSQEIDTLAKIIWNFNDMHHTIKKVDAILVLGSNDVRVAERGATLFLQGYAPFIIFSGNVGRLSKGLWDAPEADIFADKAMKMGVPENKIIIENKSTNTGENIQFTRELLKKRTRSKKLHRSSETIYAKKSICYFYETMAQ